MRKVLSGEWYCNRTQKVIGSVVYLADGDTGEGWEKITDQEKKEMEAQWAAEAEEPDPAPEDLAAENAQMREALTVLGVQV